MVLCFILAAGSWSLFHHGYAHSFHLTELKTKIVTNKLHVKLLKSDE
jgi:hypothetical protein